MTATKRKGKATREPASGDEVKIVASNRRARHDYEILETYECGIALVGSEVKSMRSGGVNLQDAYGRVRDGEVWLHGMHVKPYEFASKDQPDATRSRKLLLHRSEINRLIGTTSTQGTTLVPLRVYFRHGLAKVELAVARGRRKYDKRQAIAERDARREAERALRHRNR